MFLHIKCDVVSGTPSAKIIWASSKMHKQAVYMKASETGPKITLSLLTSWGRPYMKQFSCSGDGTFFGAVFRQSPASFHPCTLSSPSMCSPVSYPCTLHASSMRNQHFIKGGKTKGNTFHFLHEMGFSLQKMFIYNYMKKFSAKRTKWVIIRILMVGKGASDHGKAKKPTSCGRDAQKWNSSLATG